jgi:hypothetical protein
VEKYTLDLKINCGTSCFSKFIKQKKTIEVDVESDQHIHAHVFSDWFAGWLAGWMNDRLAGYVVE